LLQDFSSFAVQYRQPTTHKISAQLSLSAFQFLSSSVDPFHANWISESVLRRLVQQGPVIQFIRVDKNKKTISLGVQQKNNQQQQQTVLTCNSDAADSAAPDATYIYQQVIYSRR
jgi:hypothetical protein